ncbi:MAG: hypothetical protein LZF86_110849 [Nitrospira sp.]|nr:MAG: hypothetical protein LZF86_110849 [Nitrospira sp.]
MIRMKTRRISQMFGAAAGLTVVAYLSLMMLAAGCLFMHAAPLEEHAGGHAHHTQDSSHAPLCAWSCQALSGGGLIAEPPAVTAWSVAWAIAPPSSLLISSAVTPLLSARAPPQSLLS